MALYFADTEITGIKDLFPLSSKDITNVYFADTELFTVWAEYDGNLPATYSANGSMLADYQIYGSAGGVGDRTVNHLSVNKLLQYENSKHYRNASGDIVADNNTNFSELLIPVDENTVYTVKGQLTTERGYVRVYYLGEDFTWISRSDILQNPTYHPTPSSRFNFTTPANTKYIQIQYGINTVSTDSEILLIEGSTAPMEYVPYGYAVPMSVSDGTTSTTTPIYIGDTPLGEDEYVSFKEQKIYRMSGGVLTPTDPPVPLPALPTVDGINIVDYAGQSAAVPSRFVAKYRKEGFD